MPGAAILPPNKELSMRRRKFLQLLGITGGMAAMAPALGHVQWAVAAAGTNGRSSTSAIGVLHDSTLCIGCLCCETACAMANGNPLPQRDPNDLSPLDKLRRTTVENFTVVNKYTPPGTERPIFRKQQCNHCQEPACAAACFVKALAKNPNGPVTYDKSLCVGCRYCMIACPYNVLAYSYHSALNPLVYKCSLCAHLLEKDQEPGCTSACPTGALLFGNRLELLQLAKERIAEKPARYVSHVYGEHEVGGANWLYLSPVAHKELDQPELATTSAAELTAGTLATVPMIAGVWSVLLTGVYVFSKRMQKKEDA